jgi:hypothetical protein
MDLLADEPNESEGIDLLAEEPEAKVSGKPKSFYDLSKEDQANALNVARQQISAQYPNMPDWLRDMMLTITPKDQSPRLQKIADIAKADTNPIGVAGGGLLQGAAIPFQGIASMLPGERAKNFANEDFTRFTAQPQNDMEKGLQDTSELIGSLGPLGKLFGMLKSGTQLARVPKVLQNATALLGTGAIATPGDLADKALGAAGALALGGAGKLAVKTGSALATKVPEFLRGLTNESTPEALVESVQKPHDILQNTANKLYGYVRDAIQKRQLSIPVKQEYLDQATEILPKDRATKKLIANASTGDYNAVHDLQSQLYKKGTSASLSNDIAVQNQGEETIDLRNKINEDLENHLIQSGNVDIAHVLDQGKNIYRQLKSTYYNKELPSGIGELVHPDIRLIPENPENLFTQNSLPMKQFLKEHPEAAKHSQGIREKKAALKALRNILIGSGVAGGATAGIKTLYDFLQ